MLQETWLYGLLGGVLIGTAGAIYVLVSGRILGPTATLFGIWTADAERRERLAFLAGLIAVPWIISLALPFSTNATGNVVWLVLGGLLVGFGTRLANGCTSGHGVCGMSRLSPRSVVATAVYIGAGMAVMAVLRGLWGVI